MTETITRPTWSSEMEKELAEIVGKELNNWCNNETPLENCIESSEKVLKWHLNDNGYKLAKEFEDEGFTPDAELVEVLDSVSYDTIKIREKHIKQWVADNQIILDLQEGQTVIAKLVRKGEVECEIVKLYPETAQYGLWYEGIGYEKGKGHTIVNYENVRPAQQ